MVKPRPSLQNSGNWVQIGTKDPITNICTYRPERPPKWMFWKTQMVRVLFEEYLAVVTESQKLYIVEYSGLYPTVTEDK
jgi:hypothetical protein